MIRLFRWVLAHSLLLPVGALIALIWANASFESYVRMAHALEFPVNDIAMAFFFGLATKELVEATTPGGALHPWRRAAVPLIGAVGGMIGPAVLYLGIAGWLADPMLVRGWAIPCATDIAFSFLIAITIFGRTHPALAFLLLLAIADDALGVVILAVFYPAGIVRPLIVFGMVALAISVSIAMKRRRVKSFWPYVSVGGGLAWAGLFLGGLHPALALVPVIPFLPRAAHDAGPLVEEPHAHDALNEFEHWWKTPVQLILFLFGLTNAGVPVREVGPATWAVLAAIIAGKPLGIGLAVAIAAAAGLKLPSRMSWRDVLVVGAAAGVGFTVALFFSTAAFPPGKTLDEAKLGALLSIGSAGVAYLGAMLLRTGRFRASRAPRP
jgi:Na+:H+ antiporter, NhaA family